LELLEEIDPTSEMFTKAKTFAAFLQRQAGDFEGAAKNLREVLAKEPGNLKARSYLVLILRDNRRLSEALGFVEGGLQHAPQDESLLFQAAVILHDLGQEAASLKRMEEVLVVNPKNTDALNFIAYSLAENGQQLDRAEELIRQALEIRAQDSFYLDTLGWILFQKKNFAEAEEILSRAVELSEGDVVVFEHYGDVLVQNGKQQKAEEIYKRAQQLKKKMPGEDEKKALERIEGKLRSLRRK
ncbi:MAG: tetratricopeptide repeat protein, partial [Bdellovibrionales bacterium]|nr:tetratricopeptide repeat protein [Bdellovibrionales bacterium]